MGKVFWRLTCSSSVIFGLIISKRIIYLIKSSLLPQYWNNPSKIIGKSLLHHEIPSTFHIIPIISIYFNRFLHPHHCTHAHLRWKVPLKEIKIQIWISTLPTSGVGGTGGSPYIFRKRVNASVSFLWQAQHGRRPTEAARVLAGGLRSVTIKERRPSRRPSLG